MKMENIVCSGSFNQELDLNLLSSRCPYVQYKKNRYPGAYLKFDGHSVTIYRTGKYIMPGMRSFEDIRQSFDKVKEILSPYADTSKFTAPVVRNIVCSSNIEHELNLSTIYFELVSRDLDVVYEPEAFPGMILKIQDCTYNVFSSGKFLILGCTSELEAKNADDYFLNLIDTL
ncbi:TATA-box binding protein (TBP), component of TFIID and TFIIIB [Thermoplasmatales archaeon BRNA1]|nr:TATA-box binding protein (TBP), component of TFIID and TFIIIB [Thermoplasmatales archaeon BRNA1]